MTIKSSPGCPSVGPVTPPLSRPHIRRRRSLVAAGAALALVVAGCGGRMWPWPRPTPTPAPTPTPTPKPCIPGSCPRDLSDPRSCDVESGECKECPELPKAQWSHDVPEGEPTCSTDERPIKHWPPDGACPRRTDPCPAPPPPPKLIPELATYWLHGTKKPGDRRTCISKRCTADATPRLCDPQMQWCKQFNDCMQPNRRCCPLGCESDPDRLEKEQELMGGERPDWKLAVIEGDIRMERGPDQWGVTLTGRGLAQLRGRYPNGKAVSPLLYMDSR